jgi:hypothetical protein
MKTKIENRQSALTLAIIKLTKSDNPTKFVGEGRLSNTFQKVASVTMKTSKIGAFAKGFDEIQRQLFQTMREPANKSIAYGRSSPAPRNTGHTLEFEAIWINKLLEVTFLAKSSMCTVP